MYPIASTLQTQLNWSQYKLLISISDSDNRETKEEKWANWIECKLEIKLMCVLKKKRSPQSVTLINRRTKSAAHTFNITLFLFFIK